MPSRIPRTASIVPLLAAATTMSLLLVAAPARAQAVRPQPNTDGEQGYLTAAAGVTLDAPNSPGFSMEIAENMGRHAQAYLNLAYFDDLMKDATRAQISALGSELTSATGAPWSFSGRDRGVAFSAGARALLPTGMTVRPFIGGGAGVLNVTRKVTERTRGDLTPDLSKQFSLGGSIVDPAREGATHPMAEGVAGVAAVIGHLHLEGVYRYRRAFHTAERLDVSQVDFAAGVSF